MVRETSNLRTGGIKLAELFEPGEDRKIRLASQIGIKTAIVGVLPVLSRLPRGQYFDALRRIKSEFEDAGMTFAGVESHPVPAEKIKLGLPILLQSRHSLMSAFP